MLNGKFYTGLPPEMMARTGGHNRNRQESHIFWPDDTQKETAVDVRVKRRASLQLEPAERPPPLLQRQISLGSNCGDDVDTRQMFHKEFTKSSIHFCDDIQEEDGVGNTHQRRPRVRPGKFMKQGITEKPNATKLKLPDHTADEEYTNQKKKQLLSSKIQFYDYEAEEEMNQRNNVRKLKMDMNDKKELERNSKNSPKLQVKKNVGEGLKRERNEYDLPKREDSRERVERKGPAYGTNRIDAGKVNALKSSWEQRAHNDDYDYYERENSRSQKTNGRKEHQYDDNNGYADFDDNQVESNYLADNMERMRISKSPPKRHVHYEDNDYATERLTSARNHNGYDKNRTTEITYNTRSVRNSHSPRRFSPPNMRTGSNNHQLYEKRQHFDNTNTPDFNYNNRDDDDEYQYMETSRSNNNHNNHHQSNNSSHKSTTQNTYSLSKKLNNSQHEQKQKPTFPKPVKNYTPIIAASTTAMNEIDLESPSSPPPVDAQKHLRSNLCFHDGAIVASATPPTSGNQHQQRRNARTLADTQRVSVGLPD